MNAPLVYWLQGTDVRNFFQNESSGAPESVWEDDAGPHELPLTQGPRAYGAVFPMVKDQLGERLVDLFCYKPPNRGVLLHAVLADGKAVKVLAFDPEPAGKADPVSTPPELAGIDAQLLSGACEMDDPDRVLLFGHSQEAGSVYWMWNLRSHKVGPPFAMPERVKEPVDAAFLGYDRCKDAHAADADGIRVMRLYHGSTESAFTVTVEKPVKGAVPAVGKAVFTPPASEVANFMAVLAKAQG
ncbi:MULTISPECIES: hypothetical protein [unclassified Streptomyces]|uniref:hypothetical protein n=1 Tax=unclassified Streptomyces TaxID=2593676 RepID=UPI00381865DB